jgi:hypothetical protein
MKRILVLLDVAPKGRSAATTVRVPQNRLERFNGSTVLPA